LWRGNRRLRPPERDAFLSFGRRGGAGILKPDAAEYTLRMSRTAVNLPRLLAALCSAAVVAGCLLLSRGHAQGVDPRAGLDAAIAARAGQSASLVLERGEQSLTRYGLEEYVADCVMAGMARSGDVYALEASDELLRRAFENTVVLLKSQVTVSP
jgi:hypothetical protein